MPAARPYHSCRAVSLNHNGEWWRFLVDGPWPATGDLCAVAANTMFILTGLATERGLRKHPSASSKRTYPAHQRHAYWGIWDETTGSES